MVFYFRFVFLDLTLACLGVFKKLFDELENQCFELDKKIQMVLAGDSDEGMVKKSRHSELPNYIPDKHNNLMKKPIIYRSC